MAAVLATISVMLLIASLAVRTYVGTTPAVILAFMLGMLGLIFGAAALGVWLV